jgi:predicted thioesterase
MSPGHSVKMEPGLEGFCERIVLQEWTLAHINPSWPAVFSTPAMIAMMELACSHAIRAALPPGSITVGVRIEVDHLRAAAAGATIVAISKLVEVDGRKLVFAVEARRGADVIGRGRIYHTVVERARFAASAAALPTSR